MKQSNKLETWGNETTMNLNNILYQNIQASPYFKQLYELKTYHEVIDEIYNHVESLEPFLKGTTASTAFCLLYKLWTLRLTVKQVTGLIEHTDSPHIRALGFLYLRYVCKPASLWEWFEEYLEDEEQVQIQGGPRPVSIWVLKAYVSNNMFLKIRTIGKMCRQLLTDQKWLGTILPRIPVPIARDIEQKLKERLQPPTLPRRESPSYDLDPRVSGSSKTRRRYRTPSRERRAERDYDRRAFNNENESIEDKLCFGPYRQATTFQTIAKIKEMVIEDPHATIRELVNLVGISQERINHILTKEL
ncbi:5479_t:CDS:10, partial [Cetraspora pellucida]